MRVNKYLAQYTSLSRRGADTAVSEGRVQINGKSLTLGADVSEKDTVTLDGHEIMPSIKHIYLMLNKPVGYVCSRVGQGSKTIYSLLPEDFKSLQPVGRLDKDSSGLLLMTTDGEWLNRLAHPSYNKHKTYEVDLDKPLSNSDISRVRGGVDIGDDRPSRLELAGNIFSARYEVTLGEGRNRQIRRTFEAIGYRVTHLHRIMFGDYYLSDIPATQRFILIEQVKQ